MVYSVLLILTDGTVHDMVDTIELICLLADYPCSIIIVGVGDADFSGMEILDSDTGYIRNSSGQEASRDIVQFVEFKSCNQQGDLAQEVLSEVPEQFL